MRSPGSSTPPPGDFDPVFCEGPVGEAIVTDWAAGFLDGVMLRPNVWEPLVRHPDARILMLPLLVLGADDPECPPFGVRPPPKDEIEALHAAGAEIVPDCVVGIHAFWRERRARSGLPDGGKGRRSAMGMARPRRR